MMWQFAPVIRALDLTVFVAFGLEIALFAYALWPSGNPIAHNFGRRLIWADMRKDASAFVYFGGFVWAYWIMRVPAETSVASPWVRLVYASGALWGITSSIATVLARLRGGRWWFVRLAALDVLFLAALIAAQVAGWL
jgi:hypothetical protein